ncbi:MAG: ABC transporter permease [Roseburia sp.]
MKVTAQLALSQLKLNRKRTIGTICAIALSTSLVTAVMCFVTSGNRMLVDFLGPGYGDYGGAYTSIILVPALVLGLLIAFMSVTVISNIFAASANKRIGEFGVLKCVGGTKKQIRETVIYESLWLSMIGIPLGLVIGILLGYLGVKVTGYYVDDINELAKSIIMRPFSFSLSFYVSIWTFIFAAVFSLGIVFWSASKPAKRAGKITAIECIKGAGTNGNLKNVKVRDGLVSIFLGFEGVLGNKNVKRNKTSYKPTIRALSLGILLLLLAGSLTDQAKGIQEWMTPESKEMMVDYCSITDSKINEVTGREEEKIEVPISAKTYNEITKRLSEFGDITVYGIGNDSCTYDAILAQDMLTASMKQVPDIYNDNGETEISLLSVDDELYKKLCERAGVAYGSNLLINDYCYNDNGEIKKIIPISEDATEITLINAEGETSQLAIGGFLYEKDLKEKGFNEMAPAPVRVIVPNIDVRYFDWYCSPKDEEGYALFARAVMDEYYPILTEDSYVEQGYTVRISRVDTMVKMLNISIVLAQIVMYGFVILLIMMGFASVISTIATNIRIRSREFAVLKSIGMTKKALQKMIYSESIICIGKAALSGIVFGIAIPYFVNLSIRKMFPVRYTIPWGTLVFGIIALVGIVLLITYIEINKMKNDNIIEEIRMDVM